ncbi:MAG TPA: thioredoxin family protein [Opitutaceae bacterium]|jgi:thioredoxin-related protein|nr:thioredoxin family protein [Opitutaceae bacterium]
MRTPNLLRLLPLALALAALSAAAGAEELNWQGDLAAAQAEAARLHKPLLVDFTGSDWCGYCQKLEAEVMTTDAFRQFAGRYVLVRIDFLRHHPQDDAVKKSHLALAERYKIRGFPTLIVADASGRELRRVEGYDPGSGAAAYLGQFQ